MPKEGISGKRWIFSLPSEQVEKKEPSSVFCSQRNSYSPTEAPSGWKVKKEKERLFTFLQKAQTDIITVLINEILNISIDRQLHAFNAHFIQL